MKCRLWCRGVSELGLPRAEWRTWRDWARAQMMARSKGRADMAKGFAADRTLLRGDGLDPDPVAPCFTIWIHTLKRCARHKGHPLSPLQPSAHAKRVSSLRRLEVSGQTNKRIVWRRDYGVNGKAPQAVVALLQICGKKALETR